jgi:hypothetical protein
VQRREDALTRPLGSNFYADAQVTHSCYKIRPTCGRSSTSVKENSAWAMEIS